MTSSLVFNGFDFTTQSSPRGGRFRLTGLDNWLSREKRRDRQDKMQQAGAWESTGFDAALPITASGIAVYPDAASAALERRELLALGGNARYPLTVVDAAGEGTRIVEVDRMAVPPTTDRILSWSLVVTACDPLLYGPATFGQTTLAASAGGTGLLYQLAYPLDYGLPPGVIPGAVALSNVGTASYFPRLRIDGFVSNPVVTLVETGDQVRFTGTVAAGQWLDFDLARRRVLLNGVVSQRRRVSFVGSWLAVPVGGGSVSWSADSYDANHKLSVFGNEGAWA